MDADNAPIDLERFCDACGYSRRGLDPNARCPECGEAAPKPITFTPGPTVESLFNDPLRSPSELLWFRMTAIGLIVLLGYWLSSLEVALVMPIGSFSLGAMNFAGPKLDLAATIQRSVGRQAGEWGVMGCVAALMQAIGIWLLTTTRFADSRDEPMFSLRSVTRWAAVLAVGATLGLILSNDGDLLMPQSNATGGLLIWAILLGELPANTLLYLYLLQLSRTLHNRRATSLFRACVWVIPAVTAGGALLVTIDIRRAVAPAPLWYALAAGYCVVAIAAAAAATAGILQLLGTTAITGFGRPFAASLDGFRSLPRYLRAAALIIHLDWARWMVVLGLLLWVGVIPSNLTSVLWAPTRVSVLGNLPAMNFLGPKVIAPLLNDNRYDRYYVGDEPIFQAPVLSSLIAVWAITVPLGNSLRRRRLSWAIRIVCLMAVGMPLGVRLAVWSDQSSVSELLAFGVTFCEVPATVLLYLYLAWLASTVKGPSRTLIGIAVAVPAVAGIPILGFVVSRRWNWHHHSAVTALVAGAHATVSLTLTFLAATAILRLAWKLAVAPANVLRPSVERASGSAS